MENKNQPAYPTLMQRIGDDVYRAATDRDPKQYNVPMSGFSKHELGAFMIAQGLVTKYNLKEPSDQRILAQMAYELSAEVLNQFK